MTLEDRFLKRMAGLKVVLGRARIPLLMIGAFVFLVGGWWSFDQLDLSATDLQPTYLAILIVLMMPLSLLYSGIGLVIIGRSGGVRMPLVQATVIACHATVAEMLPVPGGMIVRSGALMARGVGMVQSVALVTASALLWIALAAIGAAIAILPFSLAAGVTLLALGAVGAAGTIWWLARKAGPKIAFYSVVHRLAGIILLSVRLFFAFLAIGVALPLLKAAAVVLAVIAGSAASITPSGLGISEILAALVANTVQVKPAAAFLAVGLDRLIVLLVSGAGSLASMRSAKSPNLPVNDR